ncbi:nucleotidyl transferase AbiEii/AbiGii toxin family protein [Curtobacterium sp. MCBD17_040]|uniref:nucleotidyl transferase AbiEii/AbiGii toxin family protein n=1 Tax=Curtobacterium sp. MCBD17_040 TaxID=2175674 RepID=UPI000DA90CF7|nr:nucleotidyl transferase AbiEii/AbiGii toxin family protein [Curtobacterium sp. MCBD17_040]WIB65533.1 nucleotidyl transferase AbiEii/AbiGii toxin family protein [Curtobacterium sp. MCBD17_040]
MTIEPYSEPAGVRAAIRTAAQIRAKQTGESVASLTSAAYFDRFLSRVFEPEDSPFVVIGGMSMLARFSGARTTTDIDLDQADGAIEHAVADLISRAEADLGDHFRFVHEATDYATDADQRDDLQAAKVRFQIYLGVTSHGTVSVDLGVRKRPALPVTPWTPEFRLPLPRLQTRSYAILALEDQIADKLAAMHDTYGDGQPSSRTKDLVDLAVIALQGSPDAVRLRTAIVTEFSRRGIPLPQTVRIPGGWTATYSKLSRDVTPLQNHRRLDQGVDVVRTLIDPVLADAAVGAWNPALQQWMPGSPT